MTTENTQMEAQAHRGKDLSYLTVYPENYQPELEYPVVIMLHGFGANMYDLANLAGAIHTKGYMYVCPNAPIPVQIGPGQLGFAWNLPGSPDDDQAKRSDQKLSSFLQEVLDDPSRKAKNSLLLGFSQGGGLTYRFGLPRPDRFSGLAALSCSLRDPDAIRQSLPEVRDQNIFIAHGTQDNPERAQEASDFLKSEGYSPLYKEYSMGHEITQEVLDDLVPWIHQVLPPLDIS